MNLYQKVRAVERVFGQLEKEVASFQRATGLGCPPGCGQCCHHPDITATPLEFLPLAYRMFRDGQAHALRQRLMQESESRCPMVRSMLGPSDKGFCTAYAERGLICRLYGFTAVRDKTGAARLATCQTLKEGPQTAFARARDHVAAGLPAPMARDYYFRLLAIDRAMAEQHMPVRKAIQEALEFVLNYYAYRRSG